jgi:excisionase family DNA binding protein
MQSKTDKIPRKSTQELRSQSDNSAGGSETTERQPLLNCEGPHKVCADPALFFDNRTIDSDPNIELLTVPEVAELLRVSISGVRRLQRRRLIPFFKVGGGVRFTKSDILSYLQKQRVEPIE